MESQCVRMNDVGHLEENQIIMINKGNNTCLLELLNICQECVTGKNNVLCFKNTLSIF